VERLLDKKIASDPAQACLADLIKASEPVNVSQARKQRVLGQVLARQSVHRSSDGAWASFLLRPAFVLGLLLLAGATAAATLGRRAWIERHAEAPAAPTATATATATAAARPAVKRAPPAPPAPIAAVQVQAPPARPAARGGERLRATRAEDPSRVVEAIAALRNQHDPVRAGTLLAEYLKIYPRGALAEEAVALSIEAAAARHSPSAAAFAEQYLRRYPSGRFRRTAEQALQQRAVAPSN
jgi:hypothetical protein